MRATMYLISKSAALLFWVALSAPVSAAEEVKGYTGPVFGEDLIFPAAPEPFSYAKANKLFKPAGAGPFPALVILPTCGGHGFALRSMSGRRPHFRTAMRGW